MTLKQIRESKNLSLRQVADKMNCSAPFICLVENGKRTVKVEFLLRLAKVYKVGVLTLIKAVGNYEER